VFVHYFTHVPIGLPEVEKRIDQLRSDLSEWADLAYREGEELRSRVGPVEGLAKSVSLEIGIAEIHRSGLVYPIRWTATGAAGLFPELNADLALTQMGSSMTSLSLDGTYEPPMGVVGRVADRIVLGRVAEATVRNWLDRLAEAVSSAPQDV
jgi:hypothetical protein